MKLGDMQEAFSRSLCRLLAYAEQQGYGIRLRELERTKYQAIEYVRLKKGILRSNHCNCLAIDLYITVAGELLWAGSEYDDLADFWENLSEPGLEHVNGRAFPGRRDVYHFSIKYQGVS